MSISNKNYGPQLTALLADERLPELGPGTPDESRRAMLNSLREEDLFAGQKIVDQAMAKCCLSALWLRYDFLDESHTISQHIETASGSYWHGIMHRREPDYGNGKYWFRRVGQHPIFPQLAQAARQMASTMELDGPAKFLAKNEAWDPYAFIDLCEAIARSRSRCELLARQIAAGEWRLLFDHCWEGAARED